MMKDIWLVHPAKFYFKGKTSHAAFAPERGRSALDAVELMSVGTNYLREHVVDNAEPTILQTVAGFHRISYG